MSVSPEVGVKANAPLSRTVVDQEEITLISESVSLQGVAVSRTSLSSQSSPCTPPTLLHKLSLIDRQTRRRKQNT